MKEFIFQKRKNESVSHHACHSTRPAKAGSRTEILIRIYRPYYITCFLLAKEILPVSFHFLSKRSQRFLKIILYLTVPCVLGILILSEEQHSFMTAVRQIRCLMLLTMNGVLKCYLLKHKESDAQS